MALEISETDPGVLRRTFEMYDQGDGATRAHALGLEVEAVAGWQIPRERAAQLLDASIARGAGATRS